MQAFVRRVRMTAYRASPALLLLLFAALGCESEPEEGVGEPCESHEHCATGVCGGGFCLSAWGDEDGDGLPNIVEARLGTDPLLWDTDGDGYSDLEEVRDPLNPMDTSGNGVIDALLSAVEDSDGDCIPDQFDPTPDVPSADAQRFIDQVCRRGVCASPELAPLVTVRCDNGVMACDYSALGPPYYPVEIGPYGCFDGLDNDCNGVTDDDDTDTDGDGIPDCADPDIDGDGVPNELDCMPYNKLCGLDCTDYSGDGLPDCLNPCREPIEESCDDGIDCTLAGCSRTEGCFNIPDSSRCDDGNPCTENVCDPSHGGCVDFTLSDVPCDNGDPCTVGDYCQDGHCVAGENICHQCRRDGDCAPFEDGDLCTGWLYCDRSSEPYRCEVDPDSLPDCDTSDDNECRQTICLSETGECVTREINEGGPCDNGRVCTVDDFCESGVCVAGQNLCECERDSDCLPYYEDNLCEGFYVCDRSDFPFECVHEPNTIVDCPSGPDTECARNECIPETGECELVPYDELCADDGNRCTVPICDVQAGCLFEPARCECLAASFSGDGLERVSVSGLPSPGESAQLTIEAWIRLDQYHETVTQVLTKQLSSTEGDWALLVQDDSLVLRLFPLGFPVNELVASQVLPESEWVYVAAVVSTQPARAQLFVGGLEGSMVQVAETTSRVELTHTTAALYVGANPVFDEPRFDGAIGEVRLWRRALDVTELDERRRLSLIGDEPDLIAVWSWDDLAEPTPSRITDGGPSGHDLSFAPDTPLPVAAPFHVIEGCQ